MNIRITKPIQGGSVQAIASKSQAHRLLICAAVCAAGAVRETFIACGSRSQDIDATARCLESLGAIVRRTPAGYYVTPISRKKNAGGSVLDCGESGSTLRFLLPVCGALGRTASFIMGGRLPARPLSALYDEMASHGCTLTEPGNSPLNCEGQLTSGTYTLPGNVSSQFISGLLFALPLLPAECNSPSEIRFPTESVIRVTGVLESRPYVDMTLDALRLFGLLISEDDTQRCFRVPGGQTGSSPETVPVEGDWSNAAFWLSAGAIGSGEITCTGLNPESRQGDRAIIELLIRFGAKVTVHNDPRRSVCTAASGKLHGIDIDAENIPDLVPVLAAVASVAEGKTTIRNAGRLRIKESDRLRTITDSLSSLGADITETENGLIIIGKKTLKGGETDSYGDHRIAMTAAVLSSVCSSGVTIKNAEAVNKSYPGFFEDFSALGGKSEAA